MFFVARVLPYLILLLAAVTPASWAQGLSPDGRLTVTADANSAIQRYVDQVSGRFGALAVSQDGAKAVSYICQSRLWKNCDDYSLEDSFISIPSGQLAAKLAERRCRGYSGGSGGCVVLFVNEKWKYQFTLAQ